MNVPFASYEESREPIQSPEWPLRARNRSTGKWEGSGVKFNQALKTQSEATAHFP